MENAVLQTVRTVTINLQSRSDNASVACHCNGWLVVVI